MSVEPFIPVFFSDEATSKVRDLMLEEGNPNLVLRVFVSGGGCAGFQYGFAFEESSAGGELLAGEDPATGEELVAGEDMVIERDGVRVLIDPVSLQYLAGARIDYEEDLDGSRFVIKNPNAKSTCGCGSSFTTADNGGTNGNPIDGTSCSPGAAVHR